jgi:glucosamine-6-phosphate deaminase
VAATPSPIVLADQAHVGALAAELVANRLRARPTSRLLLPTGHTPLPAYEALRAHALAGALPTSQATLFQLDEYCGIGRDHPRSYRGYIERELGPLGFGTTHTLNPDAPDLAAECARYDELLDEQPIGLAMLGLGTDGHVAFNEPGSRPEDGVRAVELREETRLAAAADFGSSDEVPTGALTVGLRTLLRARELLVLVTGDKKGRALRALLHGPPTTRWPASFLRAHPRLTVVCDQAAAAAAGVAPPAARARVVVVLGHREPGVSEEHRISSESLERLRRAERICARHPPRAVVLTGYTSTGGLSEAEQMAAVWSFPGVPVVLEEAGRNTAENATCSLPVIAAMGGVRAVTVVTSAWHLRAARFFAPYRRHGLRLRMRYEWRGGWLRMLRNELRLMPAVTEQRRRALAAMRLPPLT